MTTLTYPLSSGHPVVILESGATEECRLEALATLSGGRFSDGPWNSHCGFEVVMRPEEKADTERVIARWTSGLYCYLPQTKSFRFLMKQHRQMPTRSQGILWRCAVISAFSSAILRGAKLCLLHGAALKVNGGVLLLCGQSCMGKSTTAARWKACGGEVLCDDLMLLEETPEGIRVHPIPTWSRCMVSLEGEEVNFAETHPIRAILALKRSTTDEEVIVPVDPTIYFSSIYSSCFLFNKMFVKGLPEEDCRIIRSSIIYWAERLSAGESLALRAHLKGDLKKTLGRYLAPKP